MKKGFPSVLATIQPMRNNQNTANEKPLYFRLLVYSNGLYVYNSLPTSSLFYLKECISPLLWTLPIYGFAIVHLSQIATLCYSWINFFLLVKYLAVLFVKVNTSICTETGWEMESRFKLIVLKRARLFIYCNYTYYMRFNLSHHLWLKALCVVGRAVQVCWKRKLRLKVYLSDFPQIIKL